MLENEFTNNVRHQLSNLHLSLFILIAIAIIEWRKKDRRIFIAYSFSLLIAIKAKMNVEINVDFKASSIREH